MFLCHGNPTKTTYRSTLINPFPTTTTAARLVGIIQSWVSTNASFILDDLLVRVPHTSHYSSPTHLTTVPPTHLTTVPPHISLWFPHTSHYSSPTHLTTVPHTSHYSSPTHLTTVPPTHLTTVPPHISLWFPHTSHYSSPTHLTTVPHTSHYSSNTLLVLCTIMSAGESQWRLSH